MIFSFNISYEIFSLKIFLDTNLKYGGKYEKSCSDYYGDFIIWAFISG